MQEWKAKYQGRKQASFPYRGLDACKDPLEGNWGGDAWHISLS